MTSSRHYFDLANCVSQFISGANRVGVLAMGAMKWELSIGKTRIAFISVGLPLPSDRQEPQVCNPGGTFNAEESRDQASHNSDGCCG